MRFGLRSIFVLSVVLFAATSAVAQSELCLARLPMDRVTLNLRDANVQTTLRLLAQQYRVNMVVTDEVKGSVTLDFFKVPAREVFGSILEAANLRCTVAGEIMRVSTAARARLEEEEREKRDAARAAADAAIAKQRAEAELARARAVREAAKDAQLLARGPVQEEILRLRYADA